MFYWLFKRYLKRFTAEFEQTLKAEFERGNTQITPNWAAMQNLMFPRKEDK